jgi:hypothetical protein
VSILAAIRSAIDAIIGPEQLPAANTQGLRQAIGALQQLAARPVSLHHNKHEKG